MNHNNNLDGQGYGAFPDGDVTEMERRLWEYIDGESQEAAVIENLIAENAAWREKYGELLDVHTLVQATELEQPSLRFTKNVMEEIGRMQIAPAAKKYINGKVVGGIAAFFLTVIVGFLVYGFSQVDWSSGSSGGSLNLGAVEYSRMFNNSFVNVFMMANVVLGLMLLDRYLSAKRKKFYQR